MIPVLLANSQVSPVVDATERLRPLAARIEALLERRQHADGPTWTELERALFEWYESTKL